MRSIFHILLLFKYFFLYIQTHLIKILTLEDMRQRIEDVRLFISKTVVERPKRVKSLSPRSVLQSIDIILNIVLIKLKDIR